MELTLDALKADIMTALGEYKSRIDASIKALESREVPEEIKAKIELAVKRADEVEALLKRSQSTGSEVSAKSLGEIFAGSDAWKEFAESYQKRTRSMTFKNLFAHEKKTTITSTDVSSATAGILVPERVAQIVRPALPPLRVRDLIPRMPTSSNAVEYPKENSFTNAAAMVSEASSKAESALTFTIDTAAVRTMAHWIPASRQILDDWALLRAYIDTRLLEGLKDTEDTELLTGDGTGQHLSGLITEATAYDTNDNVTDDTRLDILNHAIGQCEDANYVVDGIVVNPKDWRKIQLIKTEEQKANTGSYIMGGPAGTIAPTVWGKPVALTTAMTAGHFLVGKFAGSAILFDRELARVDVSTEHSDFFVKNLVAIRAEERLALAILVPGAFRYGSF